MAAVSRKKTMLVILVALALGIFLPPKINGTRFKPRLAAALSAALGRPVRIGSVSFRLLPRPGFDLYDFEVDDDPAFSAEPLLLCGQVTADLRLTSLWQGRLEIANLKLQNRGERIQPSLNLVYLDGRWNVETLLARAEQVPTAPTAKRSAERRARFPYIEADAGRINFKIGPEKKPYALVDTDFAFWLAAEDVWHFRLQGQPFRSDLRLSDTGRIKVEGDLKRSAEWRQTPVQLQFSWTQGQFGQLSKLALGHDKGWRGAVDAKAEVTGTLAQMHWTAQVNLQDFRRYDINRRGMFALSTRCLGDYGQGAMVFNCSLPVESGGIRLSGTVSPASPKNYDLSVVANRVPLSALATFALYAKRTLPDDLTATGQADAAFAFHSHENMPEDWHGTGSTSAFTVRSSAVAPVQVSAIHFRMGIAETKEPSVARGKSRTPKPIPVAGARSLVIDPFLIQLTPGSTLQAQGSLGIEDYAFAVKGAAPLERILELGNLSGFPSRIRNTTGLANLDLAVHGIWANFSPARLGGTAHLENVVAAIPGLKHQLQISTGDMHFGDTEAVLVTSSAQFEHSPVAVSGSVSNPLNCPAEAKCPIQFDLRAEALAIKDVTTLLGLGQTGWKLPFISEPDSLPAFRANGTLAVANFVAGPLLLQKFMAHMQVGDRGLVMDQISARLADGMMQGEWHIDWSSSPARYGGTGMLTGVSLERAPLPEAATSLLASWISGKANLKYSLEFTGASGQEMLANARGSAEFTVANGLSRALTLETARPTRFQNLQGKCEIKHQVLELLESKFKAENRVYEVSGTVSLADLQAKLKVSSSSRQWDITGALDKPTVSAQRVAAQQVSAKTP